MYPMDGSYNMYLPQNVRVASASISFKSSYHEAGMVFTQKYKHTLTNIHCTYVHNIHILCLCVCVCVCVCVPSVITF